MKKVGVVVAALAVAALSGCSLWQSTDVSSFEMAVGECVIAPSITSDTETEVGALPVVDCAEPHHGEVFYAEILNAPIYPQDTAETLQEACLGAYADYVGVEYTDSRYRISLVYPSELTWDEGDRQSACLVTGEAEEELTGSVRGSGE
ncbi:septum formation family protein [Demequina globuliformis]|uniref:septum formation family protein n=1 Tax=Demequina globuliformis TaxID=676202 RepID=UPI0007805A7F|nr:septum formation family protein [Demequina globuliformis]